ncbi:response regulator [Desulforhopalus sp. IMCC35007]|uniref:response regulator n=1 Tax=Desulforhopalus sp. IMCC35007 TaxID=2569543 RepID=UPI0010AE6B5C|nr:response regulator [Desulforhopalus sp. IMCC35007]TKB11655.1 response regulator [Desulforhopalus sp. IMCC35007]
MSDREKLEKRIQQLEAELVEQKRTNKLLKKRALQAIIGNRSAQLCEADRLECEAGLKRAELSSRVKSVFLENVSHEIRSSMSGIVGMTDLVLETELSPDQRLYLEMVGSSVDRLLVVVNEILDFSRIETGEIEFLAEDFNLKESLDHDLYVMSQAAQDKDLSFTCTVDADVPTHVHGDEGRLVQIVTNIVNNAIKFTDKGSVSIAIQNHGYDGDNNLRLKFTVQDTGCGIAAEKLEQINYYFKQELKPHVAMPLSIGTTGLGLTITSQLVKLMGGEIGVESGKRGTRFWFILPYKEVADISFLEEQTSETVENIKEEATYALRGAKVLLAEDEYINRVLIETVLVQLGVDVFSVASGEEAVEEACSGKYQFVLMDIQMEGMDGLEATRRIRSYEHAHGGHIPIVALTAHAMVGDREKCLQAGMDDYLTKPLVRKEILEVLQQHLTNRALVVDSNIESQNVFVRSLIESGWQVTIAETWRSAMYEASLTHFDLIILDTTSPELQGREAAKTIRQLEQYTGQRAKILNLTETAETDAGNDFDGVITRPATREKVLQHLNG